MILYYKNNLCISFFFRVFYSKKRQNTPKTQLKLYQKSKIKSIQERLIVNCATMCALETVNNNEYILTCYINSL